MENVLKNLGRFVGEKFSLLDTIFLRKEDYRPPEKVGFTVNGYGPMLPPRPVEGDAYVLEPSGAGPYRGIYYLNFGRNKKQNVGFRIIGDQEAKAQGGNGWASADGDGIVTGRIRLSGGGGLRIAVGFMEPPMCRTVAVSVEEYDAAGGLVRSSPLSIGNAFYPADFTPAGGTAWVVVRLRGTGTVVYVKVWEKMEATTSLQKVYRYRKEAWVAENVAEGEVLRVKGKAFSLVKTAEGFRRFSNLTIPKLQLREGVMKVNDFIMLKEEVVNDGYYVRLFVRRRRLCKNIGGKKAYKHKYWECMGPREYHPSGFLAEFKQPKDIARSRIREQGPRITQLGWQWMQVVNTVFTMGRNISVKGSKRTFELLKYYPSTGLYNRNRNRKTLRPEYADVAVCLSKRVKGHFVDGERSYFRLSVKNGLSGEVVVKVIKG